MDKGYALSFMPSLYRAFTGSSAPVAYDENYNWEAEKKKEVVSMASAGAASPGSSKSVVVISIKQPILKFTDWYYGYLGSKAFMDLLDYYSESPNVAAVVFDIDSGGGQVYGTPEFYDYIAAYPLPTVAYTDGLMCSAAYYLAAACDYIIAHKRADSIGSIGAYSTYVNFTGLLEKYGVKVFSMYGTKSTLKNHEIRQLDEKGDTAPYIENQLDPIIDTFHNDMRATRPNLDEKVFTGDTWGAKDALTLGLINEIGTLQTAIDKGFSLSNNSNNNNTMSKQRANVQAVLGLDAPLASTPEKGSYLNEEQLDTMETALSERDSQIATLEGTVTTATAAQATAETALAAAATAHQAATAATATAIAAMVTEAGLTPAATVAENLTNLTAHYSPFNAADGAKPTKTEADAKPGKTSVTINATASHNQMAKQIFK